MRKRIFYTELAYVAGLLGVAVGTALTASADWVASLSMMLATPADDAPMAIAAATCIPSRIPPDAMSGSPHPLHCQRETGDGMPQSKNVSPMHVLTVSSASMAL